MALANGAQVTPQPITYQGRTVDGKVVRIQPYLDDPLHARFENYVRKTYTFVLSDEVPGGIYQVRTSLANTGVNQPAAGTVVARTAVPGAASGTAPPGAAMPDKGAGAAAAPGVAGRSGMQPPPVAGNAAQPGRAAPGAAPPSGGVSSTAQAGQAAPGAAMPVIDETLTLVKVVAPQR